MVCKTITKEKEAMNLRGRIQRGIGERKEKGEHYVIILILKNKDTSQVVVEHAFNSSIVQLK